MRSNRRPLTSLPPLCACGEPRAFGKSGCRSCVQKQAKKWRDEKHAQGLCRCGQPLAVGHKRCDACLKALREDAAARTAKRVKAKQCVHCTKRAKKGHVLCRDHLKALRTYNKVYKRRMKERRQHYAV